jgi:hypothetical protein
LSAPQSLALRVSRLESALGAARGGPWLSIVYAEGAEPSRISELEAAALAAYAAEHGEARKAPSFVHRVIIAPPQRDGRPA